MARTFYAQEDKYGFPLPGTMMSTLGVVPNKTNIVTLPAADTSVGGGTLVLHPKGFKFFIKKDVKGNIIPNSLIRAFIKPSVGLWYEWKLVK